MSEWDYSLAPIHISRSALGSDIPGRDMTVSPGQVIHAPKGIGNGSHYAILDKFPALSLLGKDGVFKSPDTGSATYHALFTGDAQILNVNGLLLETLTPAVFRGSTASDRRIALQNPDRAGILEILPLHLKEVTDL